MAKIGNLQVGTIKIANGALTKFYSSTGSTGTSQSVTVAQASPNPTILFVWATASGSAQLRRTRGNKLIGNPQRLTGGLIRDSLFDDDPADGDVYTLSNIDAVYRELSAMVILA